MIAPGPGTFARRAWPSAAKPCLPVILRNQRTISLPQRRNVFVRYLDFCGFDFKKLPSLIKDFPGVDEVKSMFVSVIDKRAIDAASELTVDLLTDRFNATIDDSLLEILHKVPDFSLIRQIHSMAASAPSFDDFLRNLKAKVSPSTAN